jgi:predicted RNase H-like nuclease (RuvC/YqgF family)
VVVDVEALDVKKVLSDQKRQLVLRTKFCQRRVEILSSKLRSQSSEVDRLEAENSELRQRNNVLQAEVVRLKRAQRTNVQDLAHIAGWLVSLANAKGVALDAKTLNILDRRGWNPSKRRSGASRL